MKISLEISEKKEVTLFELKSICVIFWG